MEVLDPQADPVLNADSSLILILGVAVRRGVNILVGSEIPSPTTLVDCLFKDVPGACTLLGSCKDLVDSGDVDLL